MPKLNRDKLLEYLDNNFSEELNLSSIVRYCEVDGNAESEKINHYHLRDGSLSLRQEVAY